MKRLFATIMAGLFLLPAVMPSEVRAEGAATTSTAKKAHHKAHHKGHIKGKKRVRSIKKHHKIKKSRTHKLKKAKSATQLGGAVTKD